MEVCSAGASDNTPLSSAHLLSRSPSMNISITAARERRPGAGVIRMA
jgi:hypothetical protein